jgi:sec-independent protein translocase protein TatC
MTFGQHLKELRSRLIKAMIGVLAALTICLVYMNELVSIMQVPHEQAQARLRVEYPNLKESLFMDISYQRPFFAYFKLAMICALFLASPVVGYQLWRFIAAGLYKNERKWVLLFAPLSFALFVGGCVFGYFLLIPEGLYFMAKLSDPSRVAQYFAISDYLDLVTLLTIVTGAVFQIPVLMMFFSMIGLTTWKSYLKFWRWAIVLNFAAAAILTPSPDPFSMILMAGPMIVLYFLGVGMAAVVGRERERPAEEAQKSTA